MIQIKSARRNYGRVKSNLMTFGMAKNFQSMTQNTDAIKKTVASIAL